MTEPVSRPAEESSLFVRVRSRILSGLFLALPLIVVVWLIGFVYRTIRGYLLDPIVRLFWDLKGEEAVAAMPMWWRTYAAPLLALTLVLVVLYLLGVFVRSRMYLLVNRLLLRVPIVTTAYQAVLNVFQALETQRKGGQYKRVVLVEFPQPGMRSVGLVTNSLKDQGTGRTILVVCVLTGVMPPSGFTLFVPEEKVTDLDWTLNQAIQAIVSGGITVPSVIDYERGTVVGVRESGEG